MPDDMSRADAAYSAYDRTTSRWGRITMLMVLVIALAAPLYLVFFSGLQLAFGELLTAFLAVAAVFGLIWVIEPLTYYPVLGPAAMYQAFMIGNIANKLVPSAIVAQQAIDAKPGTRRAELAAVMAICGAALVHLVSLLVLVGLLGTWLVSALPDSVVEVARLYIFPAIIGAVVVQLVSYAKQPRITVIALATAAVVQLGLVPVLGEQFGNFATAVVVFGTVALAWVLRDRRAERGTATSVSASADQPPQQ
ncbi:hypothetical protein F4561_001113 [Lipingzhangella halophila]|uniref:Uncharacterized protein n=1 Tax=Lipingzhangella halophila TaxID=1783352 RepID=A0A7W7REQ6_9ACTN|nr:hypothetical protein [Lipingzhangella halophila]MBB4930293.1 hypothetical protein [Lipingzhangella halophila]